MVNVIEFLSDDSNLEDIFGPPIKRTAIGPVSQPSDSRDHSIVDLGSDYSMHHHHPNDSVIIIDDSLIEIDGERVVHSSPRKHNITSDITEDSIQIIQQSHRPIPFLPQQSNVKPSVNQVDVIDNLTNLLSKPAHTQKPLPVEQTTATPHTPSTLRNKYTQEQLDSLYDIAKATNKPLLNKVNKKRTKEDIQNEMKVSISSKCDEYFKSINENYTDLIDFKHSSFNSNYPIIKFERHVTSVFNHSKLSFVPIDKPYWVEEEIIILVLDMEEIVKLLPNHGLRKLIHAIKSERSNRQIIVFANNHDKFLNKLKNNINKKYNELTRMHLSSQSSSEPQLKKRKSNKQDDESLLLNVKPEHVLLQIKKYEARGITFQRVIGLLQIFDWVKSYSYSIGKRVYDEFELNKDVAHLSSEKSGDGPEDTFNKMLTSIPRLTNRKSDEILKNPKLNSMIKMYSHFESGDEFPRELKSVLQSDVINSLRKFFTSDNENELI